MKRKLVALLLALSVVTISITACGNKTDNNTEIVETETEETETEEIETEISEESAHDLYTEGYQTPEEQDAQEAGLRENQETEMFGASLPGEGTGAQKFYAWVQSQGADDVSGWTFIYYNGKAAGSQESYGVYMKPDSPLYGTVYHIGDTLPNGRIFWGTLEEHEAYNTKKTLEELEESGNIYTDPETGEKYINF